MESSVYAVFLYQQESLALLKTPIGRLRVIAFIEGVSFLVLLCVAMPLKYFAGLPASVKIVGWVHGLLFALYLISVAEVTIRRRWSFKQVCGAIIASFIPFGTFALDKRLRRDESCRNMWVEKDSAFSDESNAV